MRAPVEGSFASLDASNGAFGFTLSLARSPLGCVLLFLKRTIGAKTGLPGSIWCGFPRAPREPRARSSYWRPFAHDTAKPGAPSCVPAPRLRGADGRPAAVGDCAGFSV